MIVSHARKFIFLKTRKTAGTSLEIALSKYCGPDDVLAPINFDEDMRREVSGRGKQNYAVPVWKLRPGELYRYLRRREEVEIFTEHMTGVAARKRLGAQVWNEYFKFTIVRNPFDRMVSRYFWSMKARPEIRTYWHIETLDQFLRHRAEYVNENWLIYTQGDNLLVDDVVRFESFEGDLARISERIGLDHNIHDDMKAIRAKGGFRPDEARTRAAPKAVIGPKEAAIVELLCAKEIERFGYAPPPALAESA